MQKLLPWIYTATVAMLLWAVWIYISKPPFSTEGWNLYGYGYDETEDFKNEREMRKELKTSAMSIDFVDVPLREAVKKILAKIESEETWSARFFDNKVSTEPITLKLNNVPAFECLRYVIMHGKGIFVIAEERVIEIRPLSWKNPRDEIMEEFDFIFRFFDPAIDGAKGPQNVITELKKMCEIDSSEIESATFFPGKYRLQVRAKRSALGKIDMTASLRWIFIKPSIKDRIIQSVRNKLRVTPPPSSDPFADPYP